MPTTNRSYPYVADNEGDKPAAVNASLDAIDADVQATVAGKAALASANTFTEEQTFAQYQAWQSNTPAQITANQNDYGISDYGVLRLSSDAARDLTGIAGGVAGRMIVLINTGAFGITLKYESASSTATNRIAMASQTDLILPPDGVMQLRYDSTTARWRVFSLGVDIVMQTVFQSSGTLTIPPTAKGIRIECKGGGAGGGSGREGAAGTVRCAGGGGGAGNFADAMWKVSDLPSLTLTITIGAGGVGGVAASTNDTNGNAGTAGSVSAVFAGATRLATALGGSAGGGGTNAAGTAGAGAVGTFNGGAGSAASTTGGVGGNSTGFGSAGAGGSAGGGLTSGNVAAAGGAAAAGGFSIGGSVASAAGGAVGTNGIGNTANGGTGGGADNGAGAGSGGSPTVVANGFNAGSGGGGGGASLNGTASGAGGTGANGWARITIYF